jgi:glutamine synthetase type III
MVRKLLPFNSTTSGNDHRLEQMEAPPAIISVLLENN